MRLPHGQAEAERLAAHTRFETAEVILEAVESFVPDNFASVSEARALLALAGQSRPRYVYRPEPMASVVRQAVAEEQGRFLAFLSEIDLSSLSVEPLPYRRVLSRAERRRLAGALDAIWGAGASASEWFPSLQDPRGPAVELEAHLFHEAVSDEALLSLLREHGVKRVYEFSELGRECEIDLELMEPYYFPQRLWFDQSLSWVFFASHEGAIGVGGAWLIERVQALWPDWTEWRPPSPP